MFLTIGPPLPTLLWARPGQGAWSGRGDSDPALQGGIEETFTTNQGDTIQDEAACERPGCLSREVQPERRKGSRKSNTRKGPATEEEMLTDKQLSWGRGALSLSQQVFLQGVAVLDQPYRKA